MWLFAWAAVFSAALSLRAAVRPYSLPDGLPRFDRLTATVDGRELPVGVMRCSKVPMNRRWPGHQRPLDQTEICGLTAFEADAPAEVVLKVNEPFREVRVRPYSRKVGAVVEDDRIRLTVRQPGQYSVEIDGRHRNLLIFVDPPKDYGLDRDDPKVRWFSPGEHDVGLIEMKTGETLYLEAGAVVYGRVHAKDADDIRILGRGILDASKVKEVYIRNDPAKDEEERRMRHAVNNVERFDAIRLEFCDRVKIDGITIRDSQIYNIRPIACRDLEIANVKAVGSWRYNADGFDLHNCERVVIRDSFVRTYDDCICIKGFDCWMSEADMLHDGYRHSVFRDVLVTNCVTWCDWGRNYEVGAETRADEIRDVVFKDCDCIRSAGLVCDVQNVDWADVHDVIFENIRAELDGEWMGNVYQNDDGQVYVDPSGGKYGGCLLASAVIYHHEYSSGGSRRGRNRRILYKDIRVTGESLPGSYFKGCDDAHRSSDITIDGLYLNGRRIRSADEANLSVGPFADPVRFVGGETFFGVDSAASWLARPDAFRVKNAVADLPAHTIGRIAETGFRQARERLSLNEVNPRPGVWDCGRYLRVYEQYRRQGIRVSGLFHDAPLWMDRKGKLPTDLVALYATCKRLGETFGDRVDDWEFWNEEDIGFCEAGAWDYASAAKAAYLGFKDARPYNPALMGALCHSFRCHYDQVLFDNDLGLYTDAMNFHIYTALSTYPVAFPELRQFLAGYGLQNLAIWVTESGTHQEGPALAESALQGVRAHSPGQERLQAEIAAKSQFAMMMEGVSRDYFFCFPPHSEQGGNKDWGVMRRDASLKPVADVFRTMIERLGAARIVGEVDLAKDVRGYKFLQPDGSWTLAYVSVGKVDAQKFVGESDSAPDRLFTYGGRNLVATAFPKYLDGSGDLPVVRIAKPRGRVGVSPPTADEDRRVVLQLKTDDRVFRLGDGKSLAEFAGETGCVTVVVNNLDSHTKTGEVTVQGGCLEGLPTRVEVPAWGKVELPCVYRPENDVPLVKVVLSGSFGGRKTSRLVMRVMNTAVLTKGCVPRSFAIADTSRWERNDSATSYSSEWDHASGARKFHLVWTNNIDRWAYPRFRIDSDELKGAVLLEFEIKSVQDKVENDFRTANVMLFSRNATRQIECAAPLGEWETRRVDLSAEKDLEKVTALSIGANPEGRDLTFWIRNVRLYGSVSK